MTSALHIVSMAQTLDGGGSERAMLRLASDWIGAGQRVTLVVGDGGGPLARELPAGADVRILGDRRLRALCRLPDIARRVDADIVFCPGNHYTGIAAWTRLRLSRDVPIVGKASNAMIRDDQSALVRWGYRRWLAMHPLFLDHVVALTPALADEVIATMGLAGDRVTVIPNSPVRRTEGGVSEVALPEQPFVLGVGRLTAQKRWDRLIAAMPALGDVPLLILGEGPLRPALAAQARMLGVDLRLPGYVGDPGPALAAAAVTALTSDYEGSPGVLREALAVGTPVVATRSSGAIDEIIASPAYGSVVPGADGAMLIATLRHWLDPATPRPVPVPEPGGDSAIRYLQLFDTLRQDRENRERSGCAAATAGSTAIAASAATSRG
ncbi:glycosyltransferase [uncultured Sphingomonas sp.]|uniref:glycosyltransferase n=1 Tax=uncultured Sphingomonas sp. TaxID=158754 RepID=UPI0035CA386B